MKIDEFIKKHYIACTITIAVLLIIIASFLLIKIIYQKNKIEVTYQNENLYQFIVDKKQEFNAKLSLEDDIIKDIKVKDYTFNQTNPLYYQSNKSIILPKDYVIVFYFQNNLSYLLPKYTKIIEDNSSVLVKDIISDNFFVYDNEDLYIFFNDVTFTYNDKTVNLSKNSYITVNTNFIAYYDYAKDKFVYEEKNITSANVKINNYGIDVLNDVSVYNSKVAMLKNNLKNLETYQKED